MLCMNRRQIASHKINIILHKSEQCLPLHNETASCLGVITQDNSSFIDPSVLEFKDYQEVMSHYHCCICVDAVIGRERCAIVSVRKTMCVREDLVLSGGNIVPSTSADIEVNHLIRRRAFWNGFVMGLSPNDMKKSNPQERRFLMIEH